MGSFLLRLLCHLLMSSQMLFLQQIATYGMWIVAVLGELEGEQIKES